MDKMLIFLLFLMTATFCIEAAPIHDGNSEQLSIERECLYKSKYYKHGSSIETEVPCLNCTCNKGVLVCFLRVCHNLVAPPNSNCRVEKLPGKCCSEIVCDESTTPFIYNTTESADEGSTSYSTEIWSTSTERYYEESTTFSGSDLIVNDHKLKLGCKLNDSVYAEGSAMPSSTFCDYCYCLKSKQMCIKPQCDLYIDGCKPVYHEGLSCCPTAYQCSAPKTDPISAIATTTVVTTLSTNEISQVCEVNGTSYSDGEAVWNDDVCKNCFCIKGNVTCITTKCALHMSGCEPIFQEGKCCPTSYNCTAPMVTYPSTDDEGATTLVYNSTEDILNEEPTTSAQLADISGSDDVSQPRTSAQLHISPSRQEVHFAAYSSSSTRTNDRIILHDTKVAQPQLQSPQTNMSPTYSLFKDSQTTPIYNSNVTEEIEESDVQTLGDNFNSSYTVNLQYNENINKSLTEFNVYNNESSENNPDNETAVAVETSSSKSQINQSDIDTLLLIGRKTTDETTIENFSYRTAALENETNYSTEKETITEEYLADGLLSGSNDSKTSNDGANEAHYDGFSSGDIYVKERSPLVQGVNQNASSLSEGSDIHENNATLISMNSEILERNDLNISENVNFTHTHNNNGSTEKSEHKDFQDESYLGVSTEGISSPKAPISHMNADHPMTSTQFLHASESLKSDESIQVTTILKEGTSEIPLETTYKQNDSELAVLERESDNIESQTTINVTALKDVGGQNLYKEESLVNDGSNDHRITTEIDINVEHEDQALNSGVTSLSHTSSTEKNNETFVTNSNSTSALYGSIYSIVSALLKDKVDSSTGVSEPNPEGASDHNSNLNFLLEDFVGEYPGEVQFNTVSYLHFNEVNGGTVPSDIDTNDVTSTTPSLIDSFTNHSQDADVSNAHTETMHDADNITYTTNDFNIFSTENNDYTESPFQFENSVTEIGVEHQTSIPEDFESSSTVEKEEERIDDDMDAPTTTPSNLDAPTTTPSNLDAPTTTPSNLDAPTTTPSNLDAPTTTPSNLDAVHNNSDSFVDKPAIDYSELNDTHLNNSQLTQESVVASPTNYGEESQVEAELDNTLHLLRNLSETYSSLHRPHIAWSQYGNSSNDDLLSGTIPNEVERKIAEIMRLAQADLINNGGKIPTNISDLALEYLVEVASGHIAESVTIDTIGGGFNLVTELSSDIPIENHESFESTHHEHSITDLQDIFIPLLNLTHDLNDSKQLPTNSLHHQATPYASDVGSLFPDIKDVPLVHSELASDVINPLQDSFENHTTTNDEQSQLFSQTQPQDTTVTVLPNIKQDSLQSDTLVTTATPEITDKNQDDVHAEQGASLDSDLETDSNRNSHLGDQESDVGEEYGIVHDILHNEEPLETEPYHSAGESAYSHAESADEEKSYFSEHDFEDETGLKDQPYEVEVVEDTKSSKVEDEEQLFSRDEIVPQEDISVDHELGFELTEKSDSDHITDNATSPSPGDSSTGASGALQQVTYNDSTVSTHSQSTTFSYTEEDLIIYTETPSFDEEFVENDDIKNNDDSVAEVEGQLSESLVTTQQQNDIWTTPIPLIVDISHQEEKNHPVANSTVEITSERVESTTHEANVVNTEPETLIVEEHLSDDANSDDKTTPIVELMTKGSIIFDALLPLSRRGRPTIDENTGHALPTPRKSGPLDKISTEEGFIDSKGVQVIPFLVEDAITEDLYSVLGETATTSFPVSANESHVELPSHDTVLFSENDDSTLVKLGAGSSIKVIDQQMTDKPAVESDASSFGIAESNSKDVQGAEQSPTIGHSFDSSHVSNSSLKDQLPEGNYSLILSVTNSFAATPVLVTETNGDLSRVSKLEDTVVSYEEKEFEKKSTTESPLIAITHSVESHVPLRPSLKFNERTEYCVEHGEVFQDGERIPTHDFCAQCKCNKGEIQCQHVSCPKRPPGCIEKIIVTSCCPAFVCNNTDFGSGDEGSLPVRSGITIHGGFLPIERPVLLTYNESESHPDVAPATAKVDVPSQESGDALNSGSWTYSDKSPFVPMDAINAPEHSSHKDRSDVASPFSESEQTLIPNFPEVHPTAQVTFTERIDVKEEERTKATFISTSVRDNSTPLSSSPTVTTTTRNFDFLGDTVVDETQPFIQKFESSLTDAPLPTGTVGTGGTFENNNMQPPNENQNFNLNRTFHGYSTTTVAAVETTINDNQEVQYELTSAHQKPFRSTTYSTDLSSLTHSLPSTMKSPVGSGSLWPSLKVSSCNIYGIMYRVGSIISVLSGPCKECKCSAAGVECYRIKCFGNL